MLITSLTKFYKGKTRFPEEGKLQKPQTDDDPRFESAWGFKHKLDAV